MKDDLINIYTNALLKELNNLDVIPLIEKELNQPITISDFINLVSSARNPFLYLTRYPRPILSKLILEEQYFDKYYEFYKDVYDFLKIEKEKTHNYDRRHVSWKSDAPDKYFEVLVYSGPSNRENLIDDIKTNFDCKESNTWNGIYVSVYKFDKFLNKYRDMNEISWSDVCRERNIPWTDDLICQNADLWDWNYLHKNPSVNWNFNLIEKNKDKVNWSFISSYEFLDWTIERLIKYKDYLIFSVNKLNRTKPGINKNGVRYSIFEDRDHYTGKHYYSYLKGSISLSENILWTKELIESVKDYWDWEELCSNTSIEWNEELIDYFINEVNFDTISSNPSIKWTEKLIEKYETKINWENISGNPNLPWSYILIKKYKDKWQWISASNRYTDIKTINFPSLSTNSGIDWTPELLKEYRDKVDFWRIALNGKLQEESVKEFHEEFNRKETIEFDTHKFSDSRETEEIYRTGWENLALNPNFQCSKDFIPYLYKKTIELTFSVGNLAQDGYYATKNYKLLELLNNTPITNLNLEELIDNELAWGQLLFNENHINDSIWTKLIKPLFNEQYIEEYHKFIRKTVTLKTTEQK
jgi:hypothetical protein